MDSEYILKTIRPYVVESQMTYDDFERAFGFLDRREQYVIVRFIEEELQIFFVDELLTNAVIEDSAETDSVIAKKANEIRASNRMLLELVKSGDEQAKQDLFVKNSGLVLKSARYYHEKFPCSLDLDDLIQEGNLGMLKAAEKFDGRNSVLTRRGGLFKQFRGRLWTRGKSCGCPFTSRKKLSKRRNSTANFKCRTSVRAAALNLSPRQWRLKLKMSRNSSDCATPI